MRPIALACLLWLAAARGVQAHPLEEDALLARARSFTGFGYNWAISVSSQGVVRIEREPAGGHAEVYRLEPADVRKLSAELDAERPWELPADIGEAIPEGPERLIEINVGSHQARFTPRRTP